LAQACRRDFVECTAWPIAYIGFILEYGNGLDGFHGGHAIFATILVDDSFVVFRHRIWNKNFVADG
jgi:hypothetical protein